MNLGIPTNSHPLDGVRVVDFGHWVAGPLVGQILGELGATVIKVEPPWGDPLSRSLPGPYAVANRGKLSLAMNLKMPGADEVVGRLVKWSDIVTHNFRPGVAERLGLGRKQVTEIDPSVTVLEISAYGFDCPSSERPGFDPIFSALSGHASRAGGAQGPPICGTRLGSIDCGTGMLGAFAAVTGLYRARRTGLGTPARISLLDASLFMMSEVERAPSGSMEGQAVLDNDRTGTHPAEALYSLADGWIALVATKGAAQRSVARSLGLPSVASRPPQCWSQDDQDAIREVLRGMTCAELEKKLAGIEVSVVPCAPETKARILASESLIEASLVARSDEPAGDIFVGFPVIFERSRMVDSSRTHIPRLGEHTDVVLRKIGFTDEEIIVLRKRVLVTGP